MKILFITANRVGDAVLSTGLLGHLAERHPLARVTIGCGPVAAPLFEDFPALDRLLPMPKRKRAGHWLDLWRDCAGTHWDLV
ncbi:MAG: LPS export ABC transporter permease LptF, partial [Alphaproteobacteria bacterium]|nr:LPS export ABC transporter permease LptF [Alphaproteobacteria bacterium]